MIQRWVLMLLLLGGAFALTRSQLLADSRDDFLSEAIRLAQASQRETGVPASVTLAQAIFESAWGEKPIKDANNYFGMKALPRQDGTINIGKLAIGWVWAWTKEWTGSKYVDVQARFRKYRSMEESFRDHGYLFAENPRYAEAMRFIDRPKEFAQRIAEAGYATAPQYAASLIEVMDKRNLYQYDLKRDEAQFVGQSDYVTVEPGQTFEIYFNLKNTGFGTWRQHDGYSLANVNNITLGAQPELQLGSSVRPNDSKHWQLRMLAPLVSGNYRTQWTLRHRNENFGPELYIDVRVREKSEMVAEAFNPVSLGVSLVLIAGAGLWVRRRRSILKARRALSARRDLIGLSNLKAKHRGPEQRR